jgi:hypothetical protein
MIEVKVREKADGPSYELVLQDFINGARGQP